MFTGWTLIDRDAVRQLAGHGWGELAVYAVTVVGMVATDLLTGWVRAHRARGGLVTMVPALPAAVLARWGSGRVTSWAGAAPRLYVTI